MLQIRKLLEMKNYVPFPTKVKQLLEEFIDVLSKSFLEDYHLKEALTMPLIFNMGHLT